MNDDELTFPFEHGLSQFKRRNPFSIRNRTHKDTVYVIVEKNRNIISSQVIDEQRDVDIIAVFASRMEAEEFIKGPNSFQRRYVIHEAPFNPSSLKF